MHPRCSEYTLWPDHSEGFLQCGSRPQWRNPFSHELCCTCSMRTNVLNRFCILNELPPSPLLSLATPHFCFSVCVLGTNLKWRWPKSAFPSRWRAAAAAAAWLWAWAPGQWTCFLLVFSLDSTTVSKTAPSGKASKSFSYLCGGHLMPCTRASVKH